MVVDVRQIASRLENVFAELDREARLQPPSISYPNTPTHKTPPSLTHEQLLASMSKKASPTPVQALSGNRLEGYCAVWLDDKRQPYIDSYGDMTVPNSWKDSIAYYEQERRATGRPHLIPHMRDHKTQIGGVLHLAEDSKGVIYQSQLSSTPLAQETYALAKDNFIGTSYGYDPVVFDFVSTGSQRARRLLKIMTHELSSVTFPANPFATAIAKSGYTPSSFMRDVQAMKQHVKASNDSWQAEKKMRYLQQVLDHKFRQGDNIFNRIEWHNHIY